MSKSGLSASSTHLPVHSSHDEIHVPLERLQMANDVKIKGAKGTAPPLGLEVRIYALNAMLGSLV